MSKTRKDPHKYYYAPNKVICVSTYAGKVVRGVAKCAPNDTYDQAFGEKLAKARCDFKIAKARYARARAKKIEAIRAMNAAIKQFHKMEEYCRRL